MYASQYAEKYKNIVSYYNGGKDLCAKAHKKKLVTLDEIRQTGFYTCLALYKNFTDYINDGTLFNVNMILKREYVHEMFENYMNSINVFRQQLLVYNTDDIFRVWKQIELVDVCGSGYIFNAVEYYMSDYDYLSVVNRIASA